MSSHKKSMNEEVKNNWEKENEGSINDKASSSSLNHSKNHKHHEEHEHHE